MLNELRRIVQEVNGFDDFNVAMQTLTRRVRETIQTEACTVFIHDPNQQQYVLMATDGLNPECVGKVRLDLDAGLIGLVGERKEPINVSNAPGHPNYTLIPEIAEEKFKAYLGVPIIYHRQLFGVLIVQQQEERAYDESEEAFLVTMSMQLAGIIAHAAATGRLARALQDFSNGPLTHSAELDGIASVPGVGIGRSVIVYPLAQLDAVPDRKSEDIQHEISSFNNALEATRREILALSDRMRTVLPPAEQALFEVYLRMLEQQGLGKEVHAEIRQGHWAQAALRNVIKRHIQQFSEMQDKYLRERADDVRDLGQRILANLQAQQKTAIDYPQHTILVGEEVTAAALAEVPNGRLVGIVSMRGSKNSHVAILARALGIPTVMGVKGLSVSELENTELIVDGYSGKIYIDPTNTLRDSFLDLQQQEQELNANLEQLRDLPAQTLDGHCLSLFINTGLNEDAGLSLSVGAEGIGLYRTEVPFMLRDAFPVEEEQRIIYRQLLKTFSPRPVIMRTLDIGGDKALPYFSIQEDNPFLGWRGLRVTLDHPEVFLVQLRAMLKASEGLDNLRIMLPMISHVGEVDDAWRLLIRAHTEVTDEGFHVKMPPLGAMIEVPSAVYQAQVIAKRVDFLSVGSNDLIQYLLAVDRNNPRVADLYDGLHPAVLTALMHTVAGAQSENKHISICGEMAGDPATVILLMGMGFDALSMSTTHLPRIKWVIRNFTRKQAQAILQDALKMENPVMVRFHLEQALEQAGLGGLVRAGK